MNQVSKNKYLSIVAGALETTAALCSTGVLMQALLASLGFSAPMIYIQTTLVQAATTSTILLASRWAADGKKLIKQDAVVRVLNGLLFLFYLPLCFFRQANIYNYILLLVVSVLQAVSTGLGTTCAYKLPYYIYEAHAYGVIVSISGVIANILSFLVGAMMSYLCQIYSYATLMLFALIFSCAFSVIAGICRLKLKPLLINEENNLRNNETKVPLKDIILAPVFRRLIPANLARGFASGATGVFAVIASNHLGYNESVTSAIVSVQAVVMLVSYVLFPISTKRISPRVICFAGSLCFLCLPFLLIPNQPVFFLLFVGIVLFGRTIIDVAIPVILRFAIPANVAGPYQAWRMALFHVGSLFATILATLFPIESILIIALVSQVYSGIIYWRDKSLRENAVLYN